jgi:hypothetical protein
VQRLDDQAVRREPALEVVQRESGDTLHVGERRAGALDRDPLEDAASVRPARSNHDANHSDPLPLVTIAS